MTDYTSSFAAVREAGRKLLTMGDEAIQAILLDVASTTEQSSVPVKPAFLALCRQSNNSSVLNACGVWAAHNVLRSYVETT